MIPVPDAEVGTPYGIRGAHWSCNQDQHGNGVHTGCDYPAPSGTRVVAARPGICAHVNYGSAFGSKQLEVRCDDGTADFYAHMSSRVAAGTHVAAGDPVGKVGAEGNTTGPHLHFERHAYAGAWNCDVHRDPAASIDYGGGGDDMDLSDPIALWSPEDNPGGQTTVGKTLNQARGYAEDAYRRTKDLESKVDTLTSKVDKILKLLS